MLPAVQLSTAIAGCSVRIFHRIESFIYVLLVIKLLLIFPRAVQSQIQETTYIMLIFLNIKLLINPGTSVAFSSLYINVPIPTEPTDKGLIDAASLEKI
jgi:hypothetical protein